MKIIEFFQSFQGEGKTCGVNSIFIRLPYCNLKCKWCDTKYHSDQKLIKNYTVKSLVDLITVIPIRNIVITGGEPLLNQNRRNLLRLIDSLPEYSFEIETNGTQKPIKRENILYNVSPKLSSSGMDRFINIKILKKFNKLNSIYKFVIKTNKDFQQVKKIQRVTEIDNDRIWIMPCATTEVQFKTNALKLTNIIKERGYNLSARLQVILWGKKKGV